MFSLTSLRVEPVLSRPCLFATKTVTRRVGAARGGSRTCRRCVVKAVDGVDAGHALAQHMLDVVLEASGQQMGYAMLSGIGAAVIAAVSVVVQLSMQAGSSLSPTQFKKLLTSKDTLVVDIRSKAEVKELGNPAWQGFAARHKSMPYMKQSKKGKKVVSKFASAFASMNTEGFKVVLLDASGRDAVTAAKEILQAGNLKTINYVAGGAAALKSSGFPWKGKLGVKSVSLPILRVESKKPKLASSTIKLKKDSAKAGSKAAQKKLDFDKLVPKVSKADLKKAVPKIDLKGLDLDKVAESYRESPTLINTGLAASALAAAGVVLFNEFDVILEAVGVLGGANVLIKRFLFAEDREKTVKYIRSLVNEKIAAGEAGDDLKRLASTILEVPLDPSTQPIKTEPEPAVEETDVKTDVTVTEVTV